LKKTYFLTVCALLSCTMFRAQENVNEELISKVAEEISSVEESATDLETLTDKLYELENDPVRINSGNYREILRLFFLSEYQIRALVEYVRINGRIVSPREILNIKGFDAGTVRRMLPFITLGDTRGILSRRVWLRQNMLANLSLKSGCNDTTQKGSQIKALIKYGIETGSFSAGFTIEKDAGEKFLSGNPPLPDFLSGYICYTGKGMVKKVIAGDFSARFGFGNIINTGFRTGLSLAEPGLLSVECEIRPYTSTDENNFFRGTAAVIGGKTAEITLFASLNNIDATTATDKDSVNYVKSLYTAGIHNTSGTLLKKDILKEFTWGINIAGYFRNLTAGLLLTENTFSLPFLPSESEPENFYDISGRKNLLAGFYYSAALGRFIISGEAATGPDLHPAAVQSFTFVPSDRISFSFLYRYFSPAFCSFHGKGVFSGSKPANTEALFGNIKFEAAKNLFLSAGTEIKRHMWVKYLANFPSHELRSEIRAKYYPEKLNIEAIYNYCLSESNLNGKTGMPEIKTVKTNTFSLRIKYMPEEYLTLLTRADLKTCSHTDGAGMLISQYAALEFKRLPLRLWFRYCIFSTEGWDTRIYAYENDLVNSFSIPALYNKGTRTYMMAEWNISGKIYLRFKYGITSKIINSDTEEFSDEIKFQVRIRL